MAVSVKIGGYTCEFIQPVPEELKCALCRHVARDPHLTSCCGEHFCQVCITPVLEDKKPCPSCEQTEFTVTLDKRDWKKIQALDIHCSMKDRGCEWTGKVEGLEAHLDASTGNCEHADVPCTNKCNQLVEKCNLPAHLADSCSKREYTCQYCNFKATYEIVSNDHWPQCPFYPVPCPNACGVQAIKRGDLEDHLLQCPLQEIECEFSHAGCDTKLPRQELEKHMEESTQKHLVLMAAMSLKASRAQEQRNLQIQEFHEKNRELQQILKEKDHKMQKVEERLQKKIQETEARVTDLQRELREQKQQIVEYRGLLGCAIPIDFTMENFGEHKTNCDCWESPPIYSHFNGYKFKLQMYANGLGKGDDTHVTVWLAQMVGEFDETLKWPAKFTITLQLLNQHQPHSHITLKKALKYNRILAGSVTYVFSSTFVSHADLGWNPQKETQYLKDDQLCFKAEVSNV